MKRLYKLCLAFVLALSTIPVSNGTPILTVTAKTFGEYNYVEISDTEVKITNYSGYDENVVIPEEIDGRTVTTIGYGAFAESKSVQTIVLPDTITTIEDNAFAQCTALKTIVLPDSIRALGSNIFKGCTSLSDVTLPNSIVTLPKGMFAECTSLTTITLPEGIKSIEDNAFNGCTSLKNIQLPSTTTKIGASAFRSCKELSSIVLPNQVKTIGASAFADCASLNNVVLPESLTAISQSAFQFCISLESITIPSSIRILGYSVFSGCSALKEVNLPDNLESISEAAFSGCSSLESIVIPESVTSIGANAFVACINLKEINLPDTINSIGSNAFSYCNSLTHFTIPSALRVIPDGMFKNCDKLETIIVPKTIIEIGAEAFAYCSSLESVVLPDSISRDKFGSRIFSNSNKVIVSVLEGSGAYSYVVNNNVAYELINQSINLNLHNLDLKLQEERTLYVTQRNGNILPNESVTWTSSSPDVVHVENGVITALKEGTATISVEHNGNTDECVVQVDASVVPIESIVLNQTEVTAVIGNTVNLSAKVNPINTTEDDTITWTSQDSSVAVVNGTGTVVLKGAGTTTIKAEVASGIYAECTITVISPITDVTITQRAVTIQQGESYRLGASVVPSTTTDDKKITWTSSVPEYASVDENGYVTANKPGVVTITATAVNGEQASCKVTIVENTDKPITSVTLNKESLTLIEGEEETLLATINPTDTTDSTDLQWSSENEEIASVVDGKVTAHKEGTTTITVTTINNKKASCVVTVEKKEIPITDVVLEQTTLELRKGKTQTLVASVLPANTSMDKTLQWSSDNPSVATVTDGVVTAVGAGTARITATAVNGVQSSCVIIVTEVHYDDLKDAIAEAEQMQEQDYTASSYASFAEALTKAKEVYADENASQSEIDEAVQNLEDASNNLVLVASQELIDAVRNEIESYQTMETSFTETEFAAMKALLEEAETLLGMPANEIPLADLTNLQANLKTESIKLEKLLSQKELAHILQEAEAILEGDVSQYEEASLQALSNAVASAKQIYENSGATKEQLDEAATTVETAIQGLRYKQFVEKQELEFLVDLFKDTEQEQYVSATWDIFEDAYLEAQNIIEKTDASQAEITVAYQQLLQAYVGLQAKANFSALQLEIEIAERIVKTIEEYEEASVEGLVDALNKAKQQLENETASQAEVNGYAKALRDIRMLARKK